MMCQRCEREIRYLPTKELEGVGFDFPYRFVAEWYDAQKDFMNALDLSAYESSPMYEESGDLYEVIPYEKKRLLCEKAAISLYGDRIELTCGDELRVWRFAETTAVTVLGRNKMNVYYDGSIYQIKAGKRFNALKYVHTYHRCKNIEKGDKNEQFLGL